jgi:hypothetical protein
MPSTEHDEFANGIVFRIGTNTAGFDIAPQQLGGFPQVCDSRRAQNEFSFPRSSTAAGTNACAFCHPVP